MSVGFDLSNNYDEEELAAFQRWLLNEDLQEARWLVMGDCPEIQAALTIFQEE